MKIEDFALSIPVMPYCSDNPRKGVWMNRQEAALKKSHIQPNHPRLRRWLVFDLDHDDSYFRAEERNLPDPHFITVNPENGHAHVGYLLEKGVGWFDSSRQTPISLYRAVERGIANRIDADLSYHGFLCKNPFHSSWKTHWQAQRPYDLVRLADCLGKEEKNYTRGPTVGFGRNCTLFDRLRQDAYREVIPFKREKSSESKFLSMLEGDALRMNRRFAAPLMQAEVRGIARSVSRWVWERFSTARFSEIQTERANLRWKKSPLILEKAKPWEGEGISRRTWYRRKAKGSPPSIQDPDMVLCHPPPSVVVG